MSAWADAEGWLCAAYGGIEGEGEKIACQMSVLVSGVGNLAPYLDHQLQGAVAVQIGPRSLSVVGPGAIEMGLAVWQLTSQHTLFTPSIKNSKREEYRRACRTTLVPSEVRSAPAKGC
jgi:hypothetical protein